MENERKIFSDEANQQLKRHKVLIEKLCRENDKLKEDVKVALVSKPSGGTSGLSSKTQSSVLHFSEEIKTIKDKLEEEKVLHEKMDEDIKNL